jgi:hypothetical protein
MPVRRDRNAFNGNPGRVIAAHGIHRQGEGTCQNVGLHRRPRASLRGISTTGR